MRFLEQLRAEVDLHGDMETDFRSRRYHQARHLAAKYVDQIEEQARIAARHGDYERLEDKALITGFVSVSEKDFELPLTVTAKQKMRRWEIALNSENELFEVFLSALWQLCEEEHITLSPVQVQITDKDGQKSYETLPVIVKNPKKEKVTAFGFPYQITF